ncbi:hypothetical protein AVP42_01187 [Agromyces sp. NDB4Y10]|uniref:DUF58 domain-containing protein n=1 Tax=Agromyces sp. NDB4Y10 TaxID=1775951 RepID=UPI0007B203E2|nr:DUF58 domain-containing protein [Agromyces sp. NDB4Y10]KZE94191.1 hypothetical protein AVP42_01187 [Agromyces sp. NDB4Y10]
MTFQTRSTIPEEAATEGLLAVVIGRAVAAVQAAASVVGRWWATARGVVTPLGWGVVAAAAAALVIGYGWGWAELVVIGWGFGLLVALASAYLAGRGAGSIDLSLPVARVAVGEEAEARLVVRNPGRRRFAAARLELPVGDRVVAKVLPPLAHGAVFDERVAIPTRRRGIVEVGPVQTVRADPIGLMRREIEWSGVRMLHVHPRTIAVSPLSTGYLRDLEGTATRDLTISDISFHALREYQPGDDRRFIHWRSSAKTGTFMVRQFEETRRSRMMVVLDLAADAYDEEDDFELAVSAAASLGARAIRDARSISFVVSGRARSARRASDDGDRRRGPAMRELATASRDRLLDGLCVVETDARAAGLAETVRSASESVTGVSLAFLVTGAARPVAELRHAASRLHPGVEGVVVRCSAEGEAAARSIGALTVLDLGYLDDLRAMIARSASVA